MGLLHIWCNICIYCCQKHPKTSQLAIFNRNWILNVEISNLQFVNWKRCPQIDLFHVWGVPNISIELFVQLMYCWVDYLLHLYEYKVVAYKCLQTGCPLWSWWWREPPFPTLWLYPQFLLFVLMSYFGWSELY